MTVMTVKKKYFEVINTLAKKYYNILNGLLWLAKQDSPDRL